MFCKYQIFKYNLILLVFTIIIISQCKAGIDDSDILSDIKFEFVLHLRYSTLF